MRTPALLLYIRMREPALVKEQFELHRQMREQQENEIESGRVPIRFPHSTEPSCH